MWAAGSATLEHVRLRQARVDAPVARLRLSYLLSCVAFQPPAMPPSALLIVRSMRDPLPGRIARNFDAAAIPSLEWESAAQSQLAALYRGAGRPARRAVPPAAEAVLFADYGELLAALAVDLPKGGSSAWWWKSLLRRSPSRLPGAWAEVWAEHPLYIPAALQQLEERGEAVEVLERSAPVQARRLLLAVLRAYNLPELTLVVNQMAPSTAPPEPRVEYSPSVRARISDLSAILGWDGPAEACRDSESGSSDAGGISAAPWTPYVAASSVPNRLGWARRALLGVSLLLRRAPQVAFSATFPLRLRAWLAREVERENRSAGADEAPVTAARPAVPGKPPLQAEGMAASSATQSSGSSPVLGGARAKESTRAHSETSAERASPISPESEDGELTTGPALSIEEGFPLLQPQLEDGALTYAGGVFYLIHFLRQAELLRFNTGLSGWALLDLLARCLLDRSFESVSGDPVWETLARLDGRRPGVPLGSGFQPQRPYEAPESWFNELDSSTQYVRFRSGRLEIWNAEGFLTLDLAQPVALPVSTLRPLTHSQRRAWRRRTRVRPMDLFLSRELRRFLHFVLPYARWRLERALGDARLEEVLFRNGTLHVSATHVDVVMGMSQISVPARLAGLDANPGWVPELGRVVTFHFIPEAFGSE